MKIYFHVLLLLCAGFFSCKTVHYTADLLPAKQIRWGEGGGFSGRETTYVLLDNGQIFKKGGINDPYTEMSSFPASKAKRIFRRAETLRLMELDFQDPGNIYTFIEIIDGDQVRRIVWGGKKPVPLEVTAFYQELQGS